jgi:hypothetical protein
MNPKGESENGRFDAAMRLLLKVKPIDIDAKAPVRKHPEKTKPKAKG